MTWFLQPHQWEAALVLAALAWAPCMHLLGSAQCGFCRTHLPDGVDQVTTLSPSRLFWVKPAFPLADLQSGSSGIAKLHLPLCNISDNFSINYKMTLQALPLWCTLEGGGSCPKRWPEALSCCDWCLAVPLLAFHKLILGTQELSQ